MSEIHFQKIYDKLDLMHETVNGLDKKVAVQNGRVARSEKDIYELGKKISFLKNAVGENTRTTIQVSARTGIIWAVIIAATTIIGSSVTPMLLQKLFN